ncbi:hypothetical protein DFQ27_004349 [Actinomortierella ambigua]|uniref:BRCT domain-containing protein n=1 Tax=Actinomortierella ambigua TaxID=1343610 RepID=A0A9P6Q3Z7_9FUNG|nr:hypothetical protein DFQ27_004349 [Actinomortierella ambigua]
MTLFDNALGDMEALLQCPLWDCIYPVLGVRCRCPTCGLPAIVKNLLRNPSYDTLVECTLKILSLRAAREEEGEDRGDEDGIHEAGHALSHQSPPHPSSATQGTVLWSFDCGPTFPDLGDASASTSLAADSAATSSSTFPSVNALMNRHIRDRHAKEEVGVAVAADSDAPTVADQLAADDTQGAVAFENEITTGASSDKIQMLRQMLGMPAWNSADRLATEELTQRTRASTVDAAGYEQLQKSKAPVAVAIRRQFDIDQDILSRVVDLDDNEHTEQYKHRPGQEQEQEQQQQGESEDEHPSLSHDDIWRCGWCKNINLMYISNEPNNICDHCQRPKETSPHSPPITSAAVSGPSGTGALLVETVPPSDGEEDESEFAPLPKEDQGRFLDVIGSSQFSLEMQGPSMPGRHLGSSLASLPESLEGKEGDEGAFRLTRQNAAIPSSSSLPHSYNSNGSPQRPQLQDTVGRSELSLHSSNGSQQQQQQHMVCCIFTGLKPEHRHAFDDNTTKLVEADLLMEQIADQDVSERTTHIVTSADEDASVGCLLCPRVLKYMYGMLSPPSVWIVRYEWFENSIHQRRWLPLPAMSEIYEVQGDTQFGPAPRVHERRQRRFQLDKKLFDGCKMFFYGDFTHKSSFRKQDILRLVQYGGATILSRKPPKATGASTSLMAASSGGGTQTTIDSPSSRSGSASSAAALRVEAAQYFAPDVTTTGRNGGGGGSSSHHNGDERPFLYVTEDIQPWQVPLDRQQPLIVCDPYSIPGKSVGGASTAAAVLMDRLTAAERKKHGWLTTGGYQAVSATWLLNCISCSLFGKGDMQALYDGRTGRGGVGRGGAAVAAASPQRGERNASQSPTSEEMLQELEDAWRRWRSPSSLSARRLIP